MTTQPDFVIRAAQPADRDAVFAMVATVWDGTDYIPLVWEEWLHATDGPMLVGVRGGQPVTLCKLTGLGPHEDWLEGVRVAPECRGQGLARAMVHEVIDISRGRGKRTLRFQTSELNPTMHRLADELGFDLAYAPDLYAAPPIIAEPAYVSLDPSHGPDLLADMEQSPLLQLTGGQYSYGWTAFDFTAERLHEHLAAGAVVGLPGERAWAIIDQASRGGFWIAHAEGPNEQLAHLFHALRHTRQPIEGTNQARAHVPASAPLVAALIEVGYVKDDHGARVYEYQFS